MTEPTEMEIKRFRALIESYGAAPERWPEGEQEAALALLEKSDAQALLRDAAPLDSALDLVEAPEPSEALSMRVEGLVFQQLAKTSPSVAKPSLTHRLRTWRAALRPAVLAISGALGLAAGIAVAQPQQSSTVFDTVELSAIAGGLSDLRAAELFEDQ